jgi:hypothetical protein
MKSGLIFYRTLAIPLTAISFICALQVWMSGSGYFVFRVLWVKILTTVVIGTFIALFRTEQFVFYNNLGWSRLRLFVFAFIFDFTIWLLLMTITVMML